MKIIVRNIKNVQFTIECDPKDTIKQLKEKIFKQEGYEVETQKLIFQGKQPNDEQTLEALKVKEGDFFVIFQQKKPQVSKQEAPPKQEVPSKSQVPIEQKTEEKEKPKVVGQQPVSEQKPAQVQAIPTQSQAQPPPVQSQQPQQSLVQEFQQRQSALVTGQELQQSIEQLMAMGFPRDQVLRALKAAYNNPDRAAEYLITGIPERVQIEQSQPQEGQAPIPPGQIPIPQGILHGLGATRPQQQGAQRISGLPSQGVPIQTTLPQPGLQPQSTSASQQHQQPQQQQPQIPQQMPQGQPGQRLAFLAQNPQFQQLRQMIQQNPQMIQTLLQQLALTNPQLFQLIAQNQEEFISMLAGPPQEGELPQNIIQVTPEEKAAIDRLTELGFDRQQAIEAFLVCDRNENAAANYLFDCAARGEFIGQQHIVQPQQQAAAQSQQVPVQPVQQQQPKAQTEQQKQPQSQQQEQQKPVQSSQLQPQQQGQKPSEIGKDEKEKKEAEEKAKEDKKQDKK